VYIFRFSIIGFKKTCEYRETAKPTKRHTDFEYIPLFFFFFFFRLRSSLFSFCVLNMTTRIVKWQRETDLFVFPPTVRIFRHFCLLLLPIKSHQVSLRRFSRRKNTNVFIQSSYIPNNEYFDIFALFLSFFFFFFSGDYFSNALMLSLFSEL